MVGRDPLEPLNSSRESQTTVLIQAYPESDNDLAKSWLHNLKLSYHLLSGDDLFDDYDYGGGHGRGQGGGGPAQDPKPNDDDNDPDDGGHDDDCGDKHEEDDDDCDGGGGGGAGEDEGDPCINAEPNEGKAAILIHDQRSFLNVGGADVYSYVTHFKVNGEDSGKLDIGLGESDKGMSIKADPWVDFKYKTTGLNKLSSVLILDEQAGEGGDFSFWHPAQGGGEAYGLGSKIGPWEVYDYGCDFNEHNLENVFIECHAVNPGSSVTVEARCEPLANGSATEKATARFDSYLVNVEMGDEPSRHLCMGDGRDDEGNLVKEELYRFTVDVDLPTDFSDPGEVKFWAVPPDDPDSLSSYLKIYKADGEALTEISWDTYINLPRGEQEFYIEPLEHNETLRTYEILMSFKTLDYEDIEQDFAVLLPIMVHNPEVLITDGYELSADLAEASEMIAVKLLATLSEGRDILYDGEESDRLFGRYFIGDDSCVRWALVEGDGDGAYLEHEETKTESFESGEYTFKGLTSNILYVPPTAIEESQVFQVALTLDRFYSCLTIDQELEGVWVDCKSPKEILSQPFTVVPGIGHQAQISDNFGSLSVALAQDGTSEVEYTLDISDRHGNQVTDGSALSLWVEDADTDWVSIEEYTTDGQAKVILQMGVWDENPVLNFLMEDGEELIEEDIEAIPVTVSLEVAGEISTLRRDLKETVAITLSAIDDEGNPVADGTPILWGTSNGFFISQENFTTDGQAQVLLSSEDTRVGQCLVTASCANRNVMIGFEIETKEGFYLEFDHRFLALDETEDGTFTYDLEEGKEVDVPYHTESEVTIHGPAGALVGAHLASLEPLSLYICEEINLSNQIEDQWDDHHAWVNGVQVNSEYARSGFGCLFFDGGADLSVADHPDYELNQGFWWHLEICPEEYSDGGDLIYKAGEYRLYLDSDQKLHFQVETDQGLFQLSSDQALSFLSWTEIDAVYENHTLRLELHDSEGEKLITKMEVTGTMPDTSSALFIGQAFEGYMDLMWLYEKVTDTSPYFSLTGLDQDGQLQLDASGEGKVWIQSTGALDPESTAMPVVRLETFIDSEGFAPDDEDSADGAFWGLTKKVGGYAIGYIYGVGFEWLSKGKMNEDRMKNRIDEWFGPDNVLGQGYARGSDDSLMWAIEFVPGAGMVPAPSDAKEGGEYLLALAPGGEKPDHIFGPMTMGVIAVELFPEGPLAEILSKIKDAVKVFARLGSKAGKRVRKYIGNLFRQITTDLLDFRFDEAADLVNNHTDLLGHMAKMNDDQAWVFADVVRTQRAFNYSAEVARRWGDDFESFQHVMSVFHQQGLNPTQMMAGLRAFANCSEDTRHVIQLVYPGRNIEQLFSSSIAVLYFTDVARGQKMAEILDQSRGLMTLNKNRYQEFYNNIILLNKQNHMPNHLERTGRFKGIRERMELLSADDMFTTGSIYEEVLFASTLSSFPEFPIERMAPLSSGLSFVTRAQSDAGVEELRYLVRRDWDEAVDFFKKHVRPEADNPDGAFARFLYDTSMEVMPDSSVSFRWAMQEGKADWIEIELAKYYGPDTAAMIRSDSFEEINWSQ